MKHSKKLTLASAILATLSLSAFAADKTDDKELADMSDPLAVYTQAGFGITDKGINIKIGEAYDTGSPTTMGMNIIELKGIFGESIGFADDHLRDNSIDSFRYRNFEVDMQKGLGKQIDIDYNVESERANFSYSFMQALPKMGPINLYPLAGLGVTIQNNAVDYIDETGTAVIDNGYSMTGTYAVIGMYGKWQLTDSIWLNYNPMYLTSISGSDFYKDNTYGADNSSIFAHEVIASYQINPRMNLRYFANFSDEVDFSDGDHRIEFNYQF